jgi:MFS family permease
VGHDRLSAVAGVCDPALGLDQRFGSKRTWIAAIALFAGGSALCALATSAGALITFRVLQGLGGGMLVLAGFTLVAQSAGPQRVGRALALIGVPILLGPIFGPIIGGLIVDSAPWPWIFVVNVPIAVVAIVVAARVLHPDAGRADAGALDWVGAALLCPGLAGIVFGLSETESQGGIDHPIAFGPIVAGLALVGLFTWHSLRVAHPLIDLRLFRSRGFRAAAATTFLLGAALFGTLLVLPLYYQVDRGESALNAGLLLAPQGIGAALMLPISGRLTRPPRRRTGGRRGLQHQRSGGAAAGARERPHPVRDARRRPRRARAGPRRVGPTRRRTARGRARADQRIGGDRLRPHLHVGGCDGARGHRSRRRAPACRARQPAPEHVRRGRDRRCRRGIPPGQRRLTTPASADRGDGGRAQTEASSAAGVDRWRRRGARWGAAMSTDTAFALGVLALVAPAGRRLSAVPSEPPTCRRTLIAAMA